MPKRKFALSFSGSMYVGAEKVSVYKWVPISPGQAQAGMITSPDGSPHPEGRVTFEVPGADGQTLYSLGNGTYRELTKEEKSTHDQSTEPNGGS